MSEPEPPPPTPPDEVPARKCERCGGPWNLPPADEAIPLCSACLYETSLRPS